MQRGKGAGEQERKNKPKSRHRHTARGTQASEIQNRVALDFVNSESSYRIRVGTFGLISAMERRALSLSKGVAFHSGAWLTAIKNLFLEKEGCPEN